MIYLPDVTVVLVSTTADQLNYLALEDTLKIIKPAEVLVWTNSNIFNDLADRVFPCEFPEPAEWGIDGIGQIRIWQIPKKVKTSHFLTVEWDGWAINPDAWTDEFLRYDYIGAVWPWNYSNYRVGNGGFSLRSVALMSYIDEHFTELAPLFNLSMIHPCDVIAEDILISCFYRPALEEAGFRWAPELLAARFSFEHCLPMKSGTFGFHCVLNWPQVLSKEQIYQRINLADEGVKAKPEWSELLNRAAQLG